MKLSKALCLVSYDGGNIVHLPLERGATLGPGFVIGRRWAVPFVLLLLLSGLWLYKEVTGEQAIDDRPVKVKR